MSITDPTLLRQARIGQRFTLRDQQGVKRRVKAEFVKVGSPDRNGMTLCENVLTHKRMKLYDLDEITIVRSAR